MAVEITFPVNETTSAGLLIMFGNIIAIILIIIYSVVDPIDVTLGVVCFFGAMLILLIFFKPEYKRLVYEQMKHHQQHSTLQNE